MTREEAKKEIIDMANTLQLIPNTPKGKAVSMSLKALEQEAVLDKIREIVDEWQSDTWTDNLSYDCMIKIAELVEPQESEGKE